MPVREIIFSDVPGSSTLADAFGEMYRRYGTRLLKSLNACDVHLIIEDTPTERIQISTSHAEIPEVYATSGRIVGVRSRPGSKADLDARSNFAYVRLPLEGVEYPLTFKITYTL